MKSPRKNDGIIEARMAELGMRRSDVAKKAGLSWKCVNLILLGQRAPTLDTAQRIARALRMPIAKAFPRA